MSHRTWLVLKHEFLYIILKPSYIVTLILVPLIPFFLYFLMTLASPEENSGALEGQVAKLILEPGKQESIEQESIEIDGLVDESGLLGVIPSYFQSSVRLYPNREEAFLALERNEIKTLYVISADYIESGKVSVFRKDFNPISGVLDSIWLKYHISYNLLSKDESLAQRFTYPLRNLEICYINHKSYSDRNDVFSFLLPYVLALFFFTSLYGSASLMLGGLEKERQNKVIEVLITSITSEQLIVGKIIGLGLVGLLQIAVWLGIISALNWLNGGLFRFFAEVRFPISLVVWSGLLFIPGYAIYAGLMAGIGALIHNVKAATQVAVLIMIPLVLPIGFLLFMLKNPDGVLSTVLSLFPLTSPVAMVMRMTMTEVPIWQSLLALGLLWGTAILVMRLVAGLFRAQYLLSNQPFRWRLLISALQGRA